MQQKRCGWCESEQLYIDYHDQVRGVPVHDDKVHFEFLTLEWAQAWLSWITILRRREKYFKAFDWYDLQKILKYDNTKIQELLQNPWIIRNKLKIASVIKNAHAFVKVVEEFGSFDNYIRGFVKWKPLVREIRSNSDHLATNEISDALSKDLKKRGFSFVGSTVIYAHLQAAGLINDHHNDCFRKQEIIDSYK